MKFHSISLAIFVGILFATIMVANNNLENELTTLQSKLNILNEQLNTLSKKITSPSTSEPSPVPMLPRGLLIYLDQHEQEGESTAIMYSLINAINRNTGPIITSALLLYKIQNNNLLEVIWNNWIIKKITTTNLTPEDYKYENDWLYLLIPNNYLKRLNLTIDSVKKYAPEKISDVELTLGLKVNHLQLSNIPISEKEVFSLILFPPDDSGYFARALYNATKNISDIFCIHTEYPKTYPQPTWSIFMSGHGIMESKMVDLRLPDFEKVLDFLEHKINTRLLVYESCYAAGLTAEKVYKDATTAVQKTYSFAIITNALTDVPVSEKPFEIEIEKFLNEATTSDIIDYQKVADSLFKEIKEWEKETKQLKTFWSNIPQIRLPGLEWFSIMKNRKDIISIGSILAKTRSQKKPLDIVTFFKTDPKVILLYAKNIPFELIINTKKLEAIVSMIPGDAIHTIKKISSTNIDAYKFMDLFLALKMLDPLKIFFIEEINNIKNIIIYNKRWSIHEIWERFSLFEDGENNLYVKEANKEPKQIKDWPSPQIYSSINPNKIYNKELYQELLKQAQTSHSNLT